MRVIIEEEIQAKCINTITINKNKLQIMRKGTLMHTSTTNKPIYISGKYHFSITDDLIVITDKNEN